LLLLALQTTSAVSDDRRLDAITLILVVIFIASMVALSTFLRRGEDETEADRAVAPPPSSPSPPRLPAAPSPTSDRPPRTATSGVPAWLDGVSFPTTEATLADAAAVIEALLSARRDNDLRRGLALYTSESLQSLHESFGFDDADLVHAAFAGDPPALRSIEIISATGNRMTARAGYSNGKSEIYRLVRLDDRWLIQEITPDRSPRS
jgi:hypothetical protein